MITETNEMMERAALESLVRAFLAEPTDETIRDIRGFLDGIEKDDETTAILWFCEKWDEAANAWYDSAYNETECTGTAVREAFRWWHAKSARNPIA